MNFFKENISSPSPPDKYVPPIAPPSPPTERPGPGLIQMILPATTAPFSRQPIGGSIDGQIEYANRTNAIRVNIFARGAYFALGPIDEVPFYAMLPSGLIVNAGAKSLRQDVYPNCPEKK
ncbi:hypothetical protein [Undibacterium sp. TC9W]|uniref:hypothetical protein n=1 Tax=Undibacterium sp. TC9W TaxID=3413053 RepID=UPI003BF23B18